MEPLVARIHGKAVPDHPGWWWFTGKVQSSLGGDWEQVNRPVRVAATGVPWEAPPVISVHVDDHFYFPHQIEGEWRFLGVGSP